MEPTAGLVQDEPLVVRHFTDGVIDPFDTVEWEIRDAWPTTPQYNNPGIEVPTTWSQNALDIVSKLYLARSEGYTEKSIKLLIQRVASTYAIEGRRHKYFSGNLDANEKFNTPQLRLNEIDRLRRTNSEHESLVFYDELCYILLHQMAAFNSPVWFNVGRPDRKWQVSACFILGVDDTTESIMETSRREAFIFKGGSGSGFDISRLRGSKEPLSSGGIASGPVSFMRMWDAGAGTFKSGGTTRRAAKLIKCDVDHSDIRDFINCKVREENRLRVLAESGMDISFSMQGEQNVAEVTSFQNANNSVGVTDEFMFRATNDEVTDEWPLTSRVTGDVMEIDSAPLLLDEIVHAAWQCADPGLVFTDSMNAMHTTPMLDGVYSPIRATNPCVEYNSNDDTSCNLASINIAKFVGDTPEHPNRMWEFKVGDFQNVIDVMTTAMDISVSFGYFPDEKIEKNSRAMRQLGLGFSNMGAAIMQQGLPYDSDQAREFAASVAALITGRTYRQSALLAQKLGGFDYFAENRENMLVVIQKHISALPADIPLGSIWHEAGKAWLQAQVLGGEHGFRNAQATVVAPAGSISYLMDCDTTGLEPAFQLVSYKELAGGGSMVIINHSVRKAAEALGGYSDGNLKQLAEGDISCISPEDLPTFAVAGQISPMGHIKMVAAIQPFISGSSSKTINMDESATIGDVRDAYVFAWQQGVKAISIYRNNSKVRQVLGPKPKDTDGPSPVEKILERAIAEYGEPKLDPDNIRAIVLGVGDSDRELAIKAMMSAIKLETIIDLRTEWQKEIFDEASIRLDMESAKVKMAEGHEKMIENAAKADEMINDMLAKSLEQAVAEPYRRRMPRTRQMICHKIHVRSAMGEHEGYVMAGVHPDGSLGEMFIEGFGKQGSFTQNALSAWATDFSIGLQYGVPMEVLCRKHAYVADETGGIVVPSEAGDKIVLRECKSIVDYISRWLVSEFGDTDLCEEMGVMTDAVKARKIEALDALDASPSTSFDPVNFKPESAFVASGSGVSMEMIDSEPLVEEVILDMAKKMSTNGHGRAVEMGMPCTQCGNMMQRAGACWQCRCGFNTGCS